MRSGERDESQPRTKHPLFDWLDNSARAAASRNAEKQDPSDARETIEVKAKFPLEITQGSIRDRFGPVSR